MNALSIFGIIAALEYVALFFGFILVAFGLPFFLAGWGPSFRLMDRYILTPMEKWMKR